MFREIYKLLTSLFLIRSINTDLLLEDSGKSMYHYLVCQNCLN